MSPSAPDILCIGGIHWDVIGYCDGPLPRGSDRPGHIRRRPGGVAFNLAVALARHGLRPALLGATGDDASADGLMEACRDAGIDTRHLHRAPGRSSDSYMAIEAGGRLVAALADTGTLDCAGEAVLAPLRDGRLARPGAPWTGTAVIDGNLSAALLGQIATGPILAAADLRLVAASDGKAARLAGLTAHQRVTLYLNRAEAGVLLGRLPADGPDAAGALAAAGWRAVLVTDGARAAAFAADGALHVARPRRARAVRVTGAGDVLVAAHVAATLSGVAPDAALRGAVDAAAAHVAAIPALPARETRP